MEPLVLTTDDLYLHVVKFGLDIYPPIDIPSERTRLNMFYEAARERWPGLFDRLIAGDQEFRISKGFCKSSKVRGPTTLIDTFVLVNRGPVFIFPLLLPEPVGETGMKETHLEQFEEVRELFLSALPGRKILRLGLIRELVFSTGQTPCANLLLGHASFAGAELVGGNVLFQYRDSKCNLRIGLAPAEITRTIQLPVGQQVEEPRGFGLQVHFDVNNSEIRPLKASDIQELLDRAIGLWPTELLEYLNQRSQS